MAVTKTTKGAKKRSSASSRKSKLEPSELRTLARLSLVLDSFRNQALHHFANGDSVEERKKRAKQIEKRVKSFQEEAMKANMIVGCPHGWCDCGGVCMPCNLCPIGGWE